MGSLKGKAGLFATVAAAAAVTVAPLTGKVIAEEAPAREQDSAQVENSAQNTTQFAFATNTNNAPLPRSGTSTESEVASENNEEQTIEERILANEGYTFIRMPTPRTERERTTGPTQLGVAAGLNPDMTPSGRIIVISHVFETHPDLDDDDIPSEWKQAVLDSREQQRLLSLYLPKLDENSDAPIVHIEAVAGYFDENGELEQIYMRSLEGSLIADPAFDFDLEKNRPQAHVRMSAPVLVEKDGERELRLMRGTSFVWATRSADTDRMEIANELIGNMALVAHVANRDIAAASRVAANTPDAAPLASADRSPD